MHLQSNLSNRTSVTGQFYRKSVKQDNLAKNRSNRKIGKYGQTYSTCNEKSLPYRKILTYFKGHCNFIFKIVFLDRFDCILFWWNIHIKLVLKFISDRFQLSEFKYIYQFVRFFSERRPWSKNVGPKFCRRKWTWRRFRVAPWFQAGLP